ncbi:MAG: hypothetical protein KME57_24340 [Scytonema hyalinum WJT4-NPBG1]|nr:hypothetical protein [Scytonema hyalinum WJT4-NPBG1]
MHLLKQAIACLLASSPVTFLLKIYSATQLNEVIIYLCPSVSICGSLFL